MASSGCRVRSSEKRCVVKISGIKVFAASCATCVAVLSGAGVAAAETEPASPVQSPVTLESYLHQFIANVPIGSGSWCSFHEGPCER